MAGRVYLAVPYVVPRTAMWVLLFAVGLIDGIRHRGVRSRGFQLFWVSGVGTAAQGSRPPAWQSLRPHGSGARESASSTGDLLHHPTCPALCPPARRRQALVAAAGLFVLQEVVLLILTLEAGGQYGGVNRATLGAYIFFADLAASFWFGILLAVAAGYW